MTKPLNYASVRLDVCARNRSFADHPGNVYEDVLLVLAEQERLSTRIDNLLDDVEQMRREIAAERQARAMAEADVAGYRRIIEVLNRAADVASVRGVAGTVLTTLRPGAALLAELDAARALRAVVQPLGSMAAITEACAAYDAAVKASAE